MRLLRSLALIAACAGASAAGAGASAAAKAGALAAARAAAPAAAPAAARRLQPGQTALTLGVTHFDSVYSPPGSPNWATSSYFVFQLEATTLASGFRVTVDNLDPAKDVDLFVGDNSLPWPNFTAATFSSINNYAEVIDVGLAQLNNCSGASPCFYYFNVQPFTVRLSRARIAPPD